MRHKRRSDGCVRTPNEGLWGVAALYAIYNTALTLAAPVGAAWLAIRPKHRLLLRRFLPVVPSTSQRPVWVHACSVGEVAAAKPLIRAIKRRHEDLPIVLTASTATGRAAAEAISGDVAVAWFPFDHPLSVRRFVERLDPRILVLIETELWPNVLRCVRSLGAAAVVVNGRLSDRHYRRCRQFRRLLRPMFASLSAAGMQNEEYAERIRTLGVSPEAVRVTGPMKFDAVTSSMDGINRDMLLRENGFRHDDLIVVFGSTRPGDEALAASCLKRLRDTFPALRLIVAPRHLDRLEDAMTAFDEPVLRRSEVVQGRAPAAERVFILDTLGELTAFYALGTVAVIGGSFNPGVEGHNPIEPAALGVPTVFGPFMRNFSDAARLLLEARGATRAPNPDALCDILHVLLSDADKRAGIGIRGRDAVLAQQGAVERNVDLIDACLDRTT